ncbi:MAG: DUF3857 domain-containing protein [Deltaproteobacteria bacterium]|nr:DUF3857 domain-containing protein [Deltaproteobacteria bacterium]
MRIANSILAWVSLMWVAVLGAGGAHAGEVSLEELWRAEPFTLSAKALRSVVVPKAEGGSATLVHTSGYRYDASHRVTRTDHLVVRILNQRGVESWGTVSAGWGPWYEARPEVRARVVTADGRELKLDPATVTEATAPSTTSTVTDRKQLVVPLPGVARGATLEIMFETRGTQTPYGTPGVGGRYYFGGDPTTLRQRVLVEVPSSQRLVWKGGGLEAFGVAPSLRQVGERSVLEAVLLPRDGVRPSVSDWPRLLWSTGGTWKDMAVTYRAQVDKALAKGLPAGAVPTGLRGTRLEKADAVLRALQARVRYTGLELGEAAVVPYVPAEVWQREYGDCKDMAVAMVDALGRVGVAAKVALLDAGTGDDVSPELPGLEGFDHAIVYVPAAGKEPAFWIDPTASGLGAGTLPIGDLERFALVIDASSSGLVPTPRRSEQPTGFGVETTVTLSEYGYGSVDERMRYEGVYASYPRETYLGMDEAALIGELKWLAALHEVDKVDQASVEMLPGAVVVRARVERSPSFNTDWAEGSFGVPMYMALDFVPSSLREGLGDKAAPFRFAVASTLGARVTLRLPKGFVVASGLGEMTVRFGPATWTQRLTKVEGRDEVLAVASLDFGKLDYTADDVRAFAEAYQGFSTAPRHVVVIRHEGIALVQSGQVTAGLDKMRAQLAKTPRDATTRARLGVTLAELGLAEAGRIELAKAKVDGPEARAVWLGDGFVGSMDLIGRPWAKGWNRAATIVAYERFAALEPGWPDARYRLASALERDEAGEVTKSGADFDKAVELYRRLAIDEKVEAAFDPYARALWRAKKVDALVSDGPKLKGSDAAGALWLAAMAIRQPVNEVIGAATSLRDVTRERNALNGAIGLLLLERRYDLVGTLGAKAIERHQALSELKPMVQLAPQLVSLPVREDYSTPELASESMIALVGKATGAGEMERAIAAIIAPEHQRTMGSSEEQSATLGELTQLLELGAGAVGYDLWRALGTFVKQGSDSVGYRVTVTMGFGAKSTSLVGYWVKTSAGFRLVAASGDATELGERALILLARGDLEGARTWLEWARNELEGTRLALLREVAPTGGAGGRDELETMATWVAISGPMPSPAARASALKLALRWPARARAEALQGAARMMSPQGGGSAAQRAELLAILAKIGDKTLDEEVAEVQLLMWERRWAEAEARIAQRGVADPKAREWDRMAASVASRSGDLAKSSEILSKLVAEGDLVSLNQLAWVDAARGPSTEATERVARRAMEFAKPIGSTYVGMVANTLAWVQLERGELGEVAESIRAAIPIGKKLRDEDHLLLGRLAEALGYPELARTHYQAIKVSDTPLDVGWTAAKRLAALGKGAPR